MISYNKDVLNRTKTMVEKSSDILNKINSDIFVEALFTELYGGNYASCKEIIDLNTKYYTLISNIKNIYDYFNRNSKNLESKLEDKYDLILKQMIDYTFDNYKFDSELLSDESKLEKIYQDVTNAIVFKGGYYNEAIERDVKIINRDDRRYIVSLPVFETNNMVVPLIIYLPDIMECNKNKLTDNNYLDGIYNGNFTNISKYPGIIVTPLELNGISMETSGGNLSDKGYENYASFIEYITKEKFINNKLQEYYVDKNNINLVGFGQGTRKQCELIYRYLSNKKNKIVKLLDNIDFNYIILATQGKNIIDKILDDKLNIDRFNKLKHKFLYISCEDDLLDIKANNQLDYTVLNKRMVEKDLINVEISKTFMDKVHPNYLPNKPINGRTIYLGKKANLDGHISAREYIFDLINYINLNYKSKQDIYLDTNLIIKEEENKELIVTKEKHSDKQIDLLNDSFEDNVDRLKNIPSPIKYSTKEYKKEKKEEEEKIEFEKNNILVETSLGDINLKDDFDEKINYSNNNEDIIDNTIIMKKVEQEDIDKFEEEIKEELEDTNYEITPILHDGVVTITDVFKKNNNVEEKVIKEEITSILPESMELKPINTYSGPIIEDYPVLKKKNKKEEKVEVKTENKEEVKEIVKEENDSLIDLPDTMELDVVDKDIENVTLQDVFATSEFNGPIVPEEMVPKVLIDEKEDLKEDNDMYHVETIEDDEGYTVSKNKRTIIAIVLFIIIALGLLLLLINI